MLSTHEIATQGRSRAAWNSRRCHRRQGRASGWVWLLLADQRRSGEGISSTGMTLALAREHGKALAKSRLTMDQDCSVDAYPAR